MTENKENIVPQNSQNEGIELPPEKIDVSRQVARRMVYKRLVDQVREHPEGAKMTRKELRKACREYTKRRWRFMVDNGEQKYE